jgi:hypothetical protein
MKQVIQCVNVKISVLGKKWGLIEKDECKFNLIGGSSVSRYFTLIE